VGWGGRVGRGGGGAEMGAEGERGGLWEGSGERGKTESGDW